MTEAEWRATTDRAPMLEFLRDEPSDRKLRLLAVGIARLLSDRMDREQRDAVDSAERLADGRAADADRLHHMNVLYQALRDPSPLDLAAHAAAAATAGLWRPADPRTHPSWKLVGYATADRQPHLIRCVLGNPFRPVALDPAWLTPTVVALAAGIYADRAFDRLPILADALQDAGCEHSEVLDHCRGDGPPARGCWAVDLVLGKA